MRKKLFFRADGNSTIGRGHISRCLAAAFMLKDELDIVFVCFTPNVAYLTQIVTEFKVYGIDCDEDLLAILTAQDYLWLDGYDFAEGFKKMIRPHVAKLIETNDIPYPAQNVDILVNHTPGLTKEMFAPYNPNTEFCLGLDYALLRPKFLEIAQQPPKPPAGVGVFICFGGADTYNLGEKFVSALLAANFTEPIYWVVKSEAQMDMFLAKNVHTLFRLNEEDMIHYMTKAKLLIIPSSVMCFEAIALRKAIFTCWFVDNQELIYNGVVKEKLVSGHGYISTKGEVQKAVKSFISLYKHKEIYIEQLENQFRLFNGKSDLNIKQIVE